MKLKPILLIILCVLLLGETAVLVLIPANR